ncbi:MAG: glycine--tRNA ligase subunit beta, partial [Acidobacteriales bacterium]|nr:glycine--tRNA ligase subunit beta [Terriglobales bacterium]
GMQIGGQPRLDKVADGAEKELFSQLAPTAHKVDEFRRSNDYDSALTETAKLRPALDKFFDDVMVMVDDESIRSNRLALLNTLLREFSTIADFSEIVTDGTPAKEMAKP